MVKKKASSLQRDIEFLYEMGSLRFVQRTWRQFFRADVANNSEHIFRVIWIALTIARREGVKNEEKIIKLALIHDIAETRTPDTNYVTKIYSTRDEEKAMHHMLEDTVFAGEYEALFQECKAKRTIEAKIVKDADNLDVDFELQEMAASGHHLKRNWPRRNVRKHLYTKTAGMIWDELQKSDPDGWHPQVHEKYAAKKDRK